MARHGAGRRTAEYPPTARGYERLDGHGHGHGHGPVAPSGRRVRLLLAALLVPCAIASVVGMLLLYPFQGKPTATGPRTQSVNATVGALVSADCAQAATADPNAQGPKGCLALSLLMSDGPAAGRGIVGLVPVGPGNPRYSVGDRVVLTYAGGDPTDAASYTVTDFQRGNSLWLLAALFGGAVLLLGRWRGLAALVALGVSFVVLLAFV
ncbi:MAG: YibE/F family protein, partial [Pseudonocardia sp.]|nr:YibE/F family protein [Pseudonocardia sp.]